MILVALLLAALGLGAMCGGAIMLRHDDWLKRSSELLPTKIEPERYSIGYRVTARITPPFLLLWGALMLIYAVSILI